MTWKVTNSNHIGTLDLEDAEGWSVRVVWDGCINIRDDSGNYLHFCDLDVFIEHLKELETYAKEHFVDWPG